MNVSQLDSIVSHPKSLLYLETINTSNLNEIRVKFVHGSYFT